MSRRTTTLIVLVVLTGLAVFVTRQRSATNAVQRISSSVIGIDAIAQDLSGYARATDPNGMSFPDAFGQHPDYRNEWWYYTGNLETAEGRQFGYQFTIFRSSLSPQEPERESSFATRSAYMAHFSVSDIEAGEFYQFERFQRGAADLAGAQASPYRVWLDDWIVEGTGSESYQMRAREGGISIDFRLEALKPPALHGNNGLAAKSNEPGNASYYYSQTDLRTEGTLTINGQSYEVSGSSWKDHEYGTTLLGEDAVGWDWFSLHLADGRELMVYQIRRADGTIEPASTGTLVREDGSVQTLSSTDFQIEVLDTWTSPDTGGVYPSRWRLSLPSLAMTLDVTPLMPNQEIRLSETYWEGAVAVIGSTGGSEITGRGYVELTGYAGSAAPSARAGVLVM